MKRSLCQYYQLKIFYNLKEAKTLIEKWRMEYNAFRPHSSLITLLLRQKHMCIDKLSLPYHHDKKFFAQSRHTGKIEARQAKTDRCILLK